MSLEDKIVEWSKSRPAWQRAVLRRVATGNLFTEQDYDLFVEDLVVGKEVADASFDLTHLPQAEPSAAAVNLVSVAHPEHVNALASEHPLSFERGDLTIIYGDNASGKSGYARLLKRMVRARHKEDILSDVFRDTAADKPKASVTIMVGDDDRSIDWPESTPAELQRMLFYDHACGELYIAAESDFPYRPSAFFVMDGLIKACTAVRERLDKRLEENAKAARVLPEVDEAVTDTPVGQFLRTLSARSTLETLECVLEQPSAPETVLQLKEEELRLRTVSVCGLRDGSRAVPCSRTVRETG